MKFFLSMAAAAMLMVSTANAQHGNQHSAIGIKAGVNIFNIHNDNSVNYDSKVGFNAGLLGHIHMDKHLALQPEIVYSSQGAKYNDVLNVENKIKLDYINVPILLQYMFDNGFRVEVGPQVGFLVNAKQEAGNAEVDIKDNLKTVDVTVAAGLSYVHPPTGLGLDARYNFGVSNLNDNSSVNSTNRGAQIGVFYLFNHKH